MRDKPVRLNLGCAARPLDGYINVDRDGLEVIRARYPNVDIPDHLKIYDFDIFHLPFADGSVDEVRADSLVEHLSFVEEKAFFLEMRRVLKSGGMFCFSTTDFEEIVKLWLAARDDWMDFFRNDEEAIASQHWFGQYSYATTNRWGYLTAMIFGSQNGDGQFHKNCYTEGKIRKMMDRLGFQVRSLERFLWKGDRDPMLGVVAIKR